MHARRTVAALAALPTSPLWTSNQGTGTASLFSGAPPAVPPAIVPLVVTIHGGPPTGQVANATGTTTAFPVAGSLGSGPARFIFATLGGAISAWTPAAEATDSVVVASPPGASYTGLTLINTRPARSCSRPTSRRGGSMCSTRRST